MGDQQLKFLAINFFLHFLSVSHISAVCALTWALLVAFYIFANNAHHGHYTNNWLCTPHKNL